MYTGEKGAKKSARERKITAQTARDNFARVQTRDKIFIANVEITHTDDYSTVKYSAARRSDGKTFVVRHLKRARAVLSLARLAGMDLYAGFLSPGPRR